MALEVAEIRNRRELREFIYLPAKVNRTNPLWIPPIYMDNWKFFDAKKNRAFQHADSVMALARRDGRVVGRIMGIVNRRCNELRQDRCQAAKTRGQGVEDSRDRVARHNDE